MTIHSSPTASAVATRKILVVDDSIIDMTLTTSLIKGLGNWTVLTASNGMEAVEVLKSEMPDLVLTDLQMPRMDGLQLVQHVKSHHSSIPVILMTAHGSEDIAIKALRSGAASYVPKKSLARDLPETLDQVLMSGRVDKDLRRLVNYQTHLESHFVLDNDPSLIPPLVGYLEECLSRLGLCDQSGLVLLGVALHEALSNAIFHGNLEVQSVMREKDESSYYQLAGERRGKQPWGDRKVYVTARLSRIEAVFVIRDEGPGFDPSTLPDPRDPTNLDRVSGRGLLLIQTFMDRVEHNETGNQITMIKRRYG